MTSKGSDYPEAVWQATVAVGGLILGSSDEVLKLASLLQDPRTSRTTSYMAALSQSAATIVDGLNRLRASTVTVVGCGGIGSLLAILLAGAGIGRLRLIDGDRIEASNLNRQLFFLACDVGELKVEVLAREILARYEDVRVEATSRAQTSTSFGSEIFGGTPGPVVVTADEPIGLAQLIAPEAMQRGWPLYTGGYRFTEGVVSRLDGNRADRIESGQWLSFPNAVTPSFGPQNGQVASLLANRVVLDLTDLSGGPLETLTWPTDRAFEK